MGINLGNIVSVGDKTVGSGISSGFDAAALIDALVAAKEIPITELEDTLEVNSEKLTAFGELRTLVDALSTSSSFMRNKSGFNVAADNIFNYRNASLVSNSSVSASNYISITADPAATIGNYDLQVGVIAKALRTESASFASKITDVTEAAAGSNAGLFSAGTFQFTTTTATLIGDTLASGEYTVVGAGDGVNITAAGISNIVVPNAGGDNGLMGAVSGFTATAAATDLVNVTVSINGTAYTASNIDASTSGTDIASGTTITFSDGSGTSFDLITAQAFTIDQGGGGEAANLVTFQNALATGIASQSIYQSRELDNFANQTSGLLAGLNSDNAQLYSNNFNATDGTQGSFGEFTVSAVSNAGVSDAVISVVIDGETYQSTTLGGSATIQTATGETLDSADYNVFGAIVGTTLSTGISAITAPAAAGDFDLMGTVSGFSATWNDLANDTVDFSVTVNGTVYNATAIAADTGGGSNEIASGTNIVFSEVGGTSFTITIGDAAVIGSQVNADTLASNIGTALASQSIYQDRVLGNFNTSELSTAQATLLSGLTASNLVLASDSFTDPAGTHGIIGGFTFNAVSAPAAGDGSISVVIDGETYTATGLGDASDLVSANITLSSATTDKEFDMNFGAAGLSVDLSDATTSQTVEDAFNTLFKVDVITSNITLSSITTDKTLSINLADAGAEINLGTSTTAEAIEAALDGAFGVNTASITVNEDDSLVDIAAAINSQTSTSNVQANIIQVNTNDYRLVLESTKTGLSQQFSIVDASGVLTEASFTTTQEAVNSKFQVNGIEIERTSNNVSDVIDNLVFNLLQVTPNYQTGSATQISANISNDIDTVESAILNFIDAYNNFRVFVSGQNQRGDNEALTEGAVLGRNISLQTLNNQIISELNLSVNGADNANFARLSSIGITFIDFEGDDENPATSNILTYDPTKLKDALSNNYEEVREIFELQFTASTSNLSRLSSTNDITLTDFKVDIDTGRTSGNEVRILDASDTFLYNATLTALGGGGYIIAGVDGTTIEGLEMIYTGDGTDVIDVGISTGIADRLFNLYAGYTAEDGIIDTEINNLNDEDDRLQEEIDKIVARIERFRDDQLLLYSRLEQAITKTNSLLEFMEAQSKSMFDN